ncbi:MAG: hypothetical protein Q9227_006180 [Pyrenula ochraceoflavens]
MPTSTEFVLDPSLFNQDVYASTLRLWLPSYPDQSSKWTQEDLKRWFAPSSTTDEQVRALAGDALDSISPAHLTLPPFESLEADKHLYAKIAAPFIPELANQPPSSDFEVAATTASAGPGKPTITASAHAALALSILLDQFPRNLFRGSDQAVVYTHYDRLARAVAHTIQARGLDRTPAFINAPVWRYWFYLPLEHTESLTEHGKFRTTLEEMLERARASEGGKKDEAGAAFLEKALVFHQEKHLRVLKEFGRFPWRNRWMGRESAEDEKRWLEEQGDRLGTG